MTDPINCPFCGGAAICGRVDHGYFQVFCRSVITCGAAGSPRPGRADAIAMWNRRAGQHPAAAALRQAGFGPEDNAAACGNTPYDEGPFTIDHERNAFEAAMRVQHPEWAFTPDPVFGYHNERTRCAWEGWQAARTHGVQETSGGKSNG